MALSKTDVVVVNGLRLEGWLDRLVKPPDLGPAGGGFDRGEKTHTLGWKTVTDPHARNSAANGGTVCAKYTCRSVVKASQGKAALQASGQPYIAQLMQLDSWAKTQFSPIPQVKRKVLTSHDAFGYFSRACGVTFVRRRACRQRAKPAQRRWLRLSIRLKRTG